LKNKCIIIAVIIRKPEIHLIITVGVEIALSIPILFANSKEVNFNKIKLPITVPKGCEIDCIKLAFYGDLVYFMDKLSSEISCIVINSSEHIRKSGMMVAYPIYVKKELKKSIMEQII
jgi:hypothetical protein